MCFLDCHSTFLLDPFLAASTVLCFEFTETNIDNNVIGVVAKFLQPLTDKMKETNALSDGFTKGAWIR